MRVAIAGVGARIKHVVSEFNKQIPEMEYVGYFDPMEVSFDELTSKPVPRFNSVEEMLAESKPDLFFIGSPNNYHLEQIKAGLEANVKIFTEKPVVTSLAQTWELAELLHKYGTSNVMVGLVLRYSQNMVDLRKAIESNQLGQIASLEASEHIAPYHGAFFMRDWRRKVSNSGGFLLEKCCHDLDVYNMLVNSRPIRVASFGGRRSFLPELAPKAGEPTEAYYEKLSIWDSAEDPFNSDADIIDFQTAIVEYQSGASLSFHTNLNAPDEHRRFCIFGSNGMAEGDFHRGFLKITDARTNVTLVDKTYSHTGGEGVGHYGADTEMARGIARYLKNEANCLPVSIVDALEAGILALSIDEARTTGKVIDLKPLWEKFDSYNLA
ncbi:Gfo/Idh/MocA family oxidoreductase [Parasalinivibrio latis]|uniref:Gfo/Idh/MocA family protein n=1 Tax=Parasalinivibrio latis TaxID=2952610 RepID=UPI0030E448F4